MQKYSYSLHRIILKDLKYEKTNCVNPLYLIFSKVNEYFDKN